MKGLQLIEKDTKRHEKRSYVKYIVILVFIVFKVGLLVYNLAINRLSISEIEDLCTQPSIIGLFSSDDLAQFEHFRTPEYRNWSLNVWANAIRIPTPSFDDLGPVGEDARWNVFYAFERYLRYTFPKFHEISSLEHVNTHGLVFTINGSKSDLKPLILMGHQDVVPVPEDTVSRWTYPPFSGHFDGKYVWGRGSSDCKNHVIAIFEALETLLQHGFTPNRTILVVLGFDEESTGYQGAGRISPYLEDKLGPNSVYAIVDEGGLGIQDVYGTRFALPGTGEKGYLDLIVKITTIGGHSSIPPDHTAIGIASDLVVRLEADPASPILTERNPYFGQLQCYAKHGRSLSDDLRRAISRMGSSKKANKKVLLSVAEDTATKYLVQSSQAADIIRGGDKVNALPEEVSLTVNHRIAVESNQETIKNRMVKHLKRVALKYNFGIEAFGEPVAGFENNKAGLFNVTTHGGLEPAPLTPINTKAWSALAAAVKYVFEEFATFPDSELGDGAPIMISPSIMTGNTDTKFYWNLTSNIYRFSAIRKAESKNIHAIDEHVDLDAHIEGVVFFHEYVRITDAQDE